MPGKTDNNNIVGNIEDNVNPPSVWNKVVKTIQNSNINVNKLIKDSITYGLDVGLFHQMKDGKIIYVEAVQNISAANKNNVKVIPPEKQKKIKPMRTSNIKSKSVVKSESILLSSVIKTRRSSESIEHIEAPVVSSGLKRRRDEDHISNVTDLGSMNCSKNKEPKMKCLRKDMVRPIPICAYCLGDEVLNKRTHTQENMISCWDCGTCAHPTCLQWPSSLIEKVRTIRWQCLSCKCCSYCGCVSKKDDDMLLCDVCDLGFHMYCFVPPIRSLPKGEWICPLCTPQTQNKENVTSFSNDDFNFKPNCQIITMENVKELCLTPKRVSTIIPKKSEKFVRKSGLKVGRPKLSLLQLKKKQILKKAVNKHRSILTDGLTMFFTPGNKRQSRVSKQSLTSKSSDSAREQRLSTSTVKDRSVVLSRTSSKSLMSSEKMERRKGKNMKTSVANASIGDSEATVTNSELSSTVDVVNRLSKESSPAIVSAKKRGRKPKIPILEKEEKPESVADASVTESSSLTMSRIEQSTSQSVLSTDNTDTEPYSITDLDRQWYSEIQDKVAQLLPPPMDAPVQPPQLQSLSKKSRQPSEHSEPPELSKETSKDSLCHQNISGAGDCGPLAVKRYPPRIQIGKYIIDTWYSAPYPSEYARLNVLFICEYCLKHIKSYDVYVMHMEKCTQYFPPGNEIYRNGDLSVFEVDGYVSKLYCQQLCLLAKLFLDHKTLYYDVEPFLFYVAVIAKNQSCHIIGYFSKEKRSTHKYNLSCIMVLPPYQKYNYGRFLIDFSYLLSRVEEQNGSPEKPLSTLGRLSYESYWKSKVIPFLLNEDDVSSEFYQQSRFSKPHNGLSITIDKISTETGINPHDVASTIQLLSRTVDLDDSGRITIQLDWDKILSEAEKYSTRYGHWVPLEPECLRWAPLLQPNERIQQYYNQTANISTNVSDTSINQNFPDEPEPEHKPAKKIKSLKSRKPINKKISKSTESKESEPDQEPIVVSEIKTVEENDSPGQIETVETPKPVIISPSKTNNSPKAQHKIETRTLFTCRRNIRRFMKEKLPMVTRNKMNSFTEEVTVDVNVAPDISTEESQIETKAISESSSSDRSRPINDRTIKDNLDMLSIDINETTTKRRSMRNNKPQLDLCTTKESDLPSELPEIAPIQVDLTVSDNSDNQDDDCVEISAPVSTRQMDWRRNKPVLEMFKDTMTSTFDDTDKETDRSKPSPTINLSEPSPVSTGHNAIICPTLICPDSDLDQDSDPDHILTSGRQPVIILEKCDVIKSRIAIDLSKNIDGIFSPFIDLESRELNITVSESSSKTNSPTVVSVEEVLKLDDELNGSNATLQYCPSEESKDESSNSLQLSTELSLNEEFRRFYNDGNVFNVIGTSHTTDSSDKDANESLLSMSNSDPEMVASFSCDSSLYNPTKSRRRSPGPKYHVQNQVSSTTAAANNFIVPNADWNSPIKHLETLCVLVDPLSPVVTLSDLKKLPQRLPILKREEMVEHQKSSSLSSSERNIVSSSLDGGAVSGDDIVVVVGEEDIDSSLDRSLPAADDDCSKLD